VDDATHPERGLLPRCIEHIFATVAAKSAAATGASDDGERPAGSSAASVGVAAAPTFVLKASYLEVRRC
jgi:hypothetical protein